MVALGHDRATIVGHSLGGGIAMQFAYQFPERCERLVLVSSGGLGREVHPLLRAATLPGSEWVLPLLTHARVLGAGEAVGRLIGMLRLQAGTDLAEVARGFASLGDAEARVGVHRDDARGARPGRPAGQRARPPLPGRGAAVAARLGRRPTRSSRPSTAAPRTRRCPAAGSRCSTASATSRSSSARTSSQRLLADFVAETEPAELDTSMRECLRAGLRRRGAAGSARRASGGSALLRG